MAALNESTLTDLAVVPGGGLVKLVVQAFTSALTGLYVSARRTPNHPWEILADSQADYASEVGVQGVSTALGSPVMTLAAGDTATMYVVAHEYSDVRVQACGPGSAACVPDLVGAPSDTSLRHVGTGTFVHDTLHPSNTFGSSRCPHYVRESVKSLRVVLPNWWVGSTSSYVETNGTQPATYQGSIEYPAGVFTQLTFSGNPDGVVAAGGLLVSDACVVDIPANAKFWTRLRMQSTGRISYFSLYYGDGSAEATFGTTAGAVPNTTMSAVAGTPVAASGGAIICPVAIIAESSKPAIALMGDSISIGRGDTGDASSRQGYLARALGGRYAYMHLGVSGDTLQNYNASKAKRNALLVYASHVVLQYGTNDVTNSRTAAQILADTNTAISAFGTRPVALCTLVPRVSTTDAGITLANQTVLASEAVRLVVNAQRRNGLANVSTVFDVERTAESSYLSGKWQVITGTISPGTAAYADDGIHPNRTGYLAIAGNINVSSFV